MNTLYMFVTEWCPYCKAALSWVNELKAENPHYSKVDIKIIDEEKEPEIAGKYDYYYVPTFFLNNEKLHEGVPTKDIIKEVFEKALNAGDSG
ncbi:MAG: thioredoxin family protein [Clostridia bacterium]|nr:thioredoxin family protein [Clostridia bacterium]